jgi:chromosome segregation ATPase
MDQYELLKDDITDDRQRFKVALKTSHTTTDQLLAALDQLVGAMDSAKAEFSHAFEENRNKRIGEAEASLKATDAQIATYEKQMQAIQETIASLRTKRDTDAHAIQHEAQRLDGIRASFEAAHAQVVHRLQAQKSRVETMPKV